MSLLITQIDLQEKIPEKRFFSLKIAGYVLLSWLFYLMLLVFLFTVLAMVFQLMDDLKDFIGKSIHYQEILLYFLCQLPGRMIYIFPISVHFATIKTVFDLSEHHEIIGMRSVGISASQIFFPFLLMALLIAILLWVNNEMLVPYSIHYASNIYQQTKTISSNSTKKNTQQPLIVFRNYKANRDWLIHTLTDQGEALEVYIKQKDRYGRLKWELWSPRAIYSKQDQCWQFFGFFRQHYREGEIWPELEEKKGVDKLPELQENPFEINLFYYLSSAPSLSFFHLFHITFHLQEILPKKTYQTLATSFWHRLCFPLICPIAVMIVAPLTHRTRRTGIVNMFFLVFSLFLAVYGLVQLGVMAGSMGILSPVLAGTIPILLAIGGSILLLFRYL